MAVRSSESRKSSRIRLRGGTRVAEVEAGVARYARAALPRAPLHALAPAWVAAFLHRGRGSPRTCCPRQETACRRPLASNAHTRRECGLRPIRGAYPPRLRPPSCLRRLRGGGVGSVLDAMWRNRPTCQPLTAAPASRPPLPPGGAGALPSALCQRSYLGTTNREKEGGRGLYSQASALEVSPTRVAFTSSVHRHDSITKGPPQNRYLRLTTAPPSTRFGVSERTTGCATAATYRAASVKGTLRSSSGQRGASSRRKM